MKGKLLHLLLARLGVSACCWIAATAFAQPAANPSLWLKADSLALSDGAPVSVWPDASGQGFDATQATAANQPVFRLNALNGLPVVRFSDDGSTAAAPNPNLDFLVSPLPLNAQSNDFTAFIVFRANVAGARDTLLQPLGAGNTVLYVETNAAPATNLYSFASGRSLMGTRPYAAGAWTLVAVEQNTVAQTLKLYRDGAPDGSAPIGPNSDPSSGGWLLGCNKPLTSHGLDGDIAEVLIYPRVLSGTERRATQQYLADKYGLPLWRPLEVEAVAFHKATYSNKYGSESGSIDNGGAMFLQVRNQGDTTEILTNLAVNGVGVTNLANFRWWRVWPPTLPPGGVSTIMVKANGAPLAEGASVSNFLQFASGEMAIATGTLTTPLLRLGSVVPSRDYRTLHLYLRNLDTVPCTVQSVFVNGDVTAQATFVGGATIPANRVGIVKVGFASPLPELADLGVRVTAARSGGGTATVAAPVKLIEPWFPIGMWSGSLADTPSRQQFVRSNLLDTVAGTPNSGNINTMAERYQIKPVPFAFTSSTNRAPDPNQVLPNVGNRNLRAWFIRDEPDINSVPSAEVAAHHLAFAQLDRTHPTYLNLAANRQFNEYGHIPDVIGMDHYAAYSAPNVIPSTWVTRKASLEEALDYAEVLKANTEPKRMWIWPQGVAGTWGTQPRDWAIDLQFWMAIQGGAKGYFWFTYKDNEVNLSPDGFTAMQRATRKLAQVRGLLLYGEVVDNVASSNSKLIARSIVGEHAVVVPVINVNYSIGGLAFAPSYSLSSASGTLTIPVPPWLWPVAQVYEVTENGKVPVTSTPAGSDLQLSVSLGNTAATCSKVFVIGNPDTQPPDRPARLNLADINTGNALVLSWEEPFDNHGTMGYRVLSNGVPVADVRVPLHVTPPLDDLALGSTEFSVQAYDSSTNLSPASPAVRYARWDFHTDGYLDDWWLANHIAAPLVTNGILSFDVTGIDPYLIVAAPNVNGSHFTRVEVRLRNPTASTTAQVFWTTATDGAFDQAKSQMFTVTANDSGFRTYTVDLSGRSNWIGQTITQLRLDPVANVTSGRIEIDYIAFVGPSPPSQPNQPPSFVKGPDQRVSTNAGPQTVPAWATGISPGASNEAGQTLTFLVTNSNPSLFAAQPQVAPNGTLSFTPAPGVTGGATVRVQLKDDGGTANGGRDVSAVLSFTITVTPDGDPPPARGGPPNIVLILADDLGYGDVGVYGQNARFTNGLPAIRTPNLDRMAAEGMRLTQFYAVPSCAPSRAALMTGLHSGHGAIRANATSVNLRREDPILPELLRAAGYSNGMFGKWGLGEADETAQSPTAAGQVAVGDAQPLRKGFDEFYGYLSHVAAHYSYVTDLFAQRGYRLWDTVGASLVAQEVITNYTQDVFAERALNFIARHRTNRFFLYLPFTPPHANSSMNRMDAPEIEPEYFDKPWPETERKFASIITRMDRHAGLIYDKLVELGLERDTVVLFTSDNGPHAAGGHDPNFFDSNGPLRDRKFTVYEGGIRVPFIAWAPGRIAAAGLSHQVSAVWDLLPTICDLAAAPSLPGIDGISFAPTLTGNPAAQSAHSHLFWTDGDAGRAVRSNDWKAVRLGTNALELYNLAVDMGEATNLAAANPAIVAQMEALLTASETAPWQPALPVLAVQPAGPLSFGDVRVGDPPVTISFTVSNAATGYAGLMSGTVAAALTDTRFTAQTGAFGPLMAGGVSAPFTVTFTPATPAPLTNQSLIVTGRLHGFDTPAAANSPLVLPLEVTLLPPAPRPIRRLELGPAGANLLIEGVSGLSYTVLASTNLVDWETIGSGAPNNEGWFHFLETNANLWPRRFYRSAWP